MYIRLKGLLTFFQKIDFLYIMTYYFGYIRVRSRKILSNFYSVSIFLSILILNISFTVTLTSINHFLKRCNTVF